MAEQYEASTSFLGQPLRSKPTASVLANTTQVLLTGGGSFSTSKDRSPICSKGTDSRSANTSIPRPVPAAHLSFIKKAETLPFSSQRMALQSCPPMSRTVREGHVDPAVTGPHDVPEAVWGQAGTLECPFHGLASAVRAVGPGAHAGERKSV